MQVGALVLVGSIYSTSKMMHGPINIRFTIIQVCDQTVTVITEKHKETKLV